MPDKDVRGKKIGKYELLTHLSTGGMAELFLGSMKGPGGFEKYVVIKRILPTAASSQSFREMFLDEARITAGFSHPNITQTFDIGEDKDGLWVALEFVPGANLNEVFNACVAQQAVLPLGFSASVARDCAVALHYAHTFKKPSGQESPVIHRDVAQKNIMVSWDGQVKLLDFGIAKARGALSRTNSGTVKGTAGYMSPEQARGDALDGRSDVFSLGVVLWEMSTGERLFSADNELKEVHMVLNEQARRPSEVEPAVPEVLSEVILQALAKRADERFLTGKEFARALDTRCPELLFDQEERAGFMKQLFEKRIAEQRALFDLKEENSYVRLKAVLAPEAGPGEHAAGTTKRRKVRTGAGTAVRKKRDPAAEPPPRDPAEEKLLQAQIALAASTAEAAGEPRQWTTPLVVVILASIGMLVAWKLIVDDTRPAASGLTRFPGEPLEEELPPRGPTPLDNPLRPIVLKGPDTTGAATPPIAVVPDRPRPPPDDDPAPTRGAPGSMTLALLPEAVVSENGKELGRGSLVTLKLPAGTHLLSVVGPDGVKRTLSLKLKPGKNTALKLQVAELPAKP